MNKEIRIVFTPEEMEDIQKAKEFFNEKTKKKALARILKYFIRVNHL